MIGGGLFCGTPDLAPERPSETASNAATHQRSATPNPFTPLPPIFPQPPPTLVSAQEASGVLQGSHKPPTLAQSFLCGTYHATPTPAPPPSHTARSHRETHTHPHAPSLTSQNESTEENKNAPRPRPQEKSQSNKEKNLLEQTSESQRECSPAQVANKGEPRKRSSDNALDAPSPTEPAARSPKYVPEARLLSASSSGSSSQSDCPPLSAPFPTRPLTATQLAELVQQRDLFASSSGSSSSSCHTSHVTRSGLSLCPPKNLEPEAREKEARQAD